MALARVGQWYLIRAEKRLFVARCAGRVFALGYGVLVLQQVAGEWRTRRDKRLLGS